MRPGDRVAYIGASGPEFAEVMYGAAKCRAIFTAVNNRLSAREVLAILADAEPRVVVTDPAAAPLVAGVGTLGWTATSWSPTATITPGATPRPPMIPASRPRRTRPRSCCTPRAPPARPRASS